MRISIINTIRANQEMREPGCAFKITDARILRLSPAVITEAWTVENCRNKACYYLFEYTPLPNGATNIGVTIPTDEANAVIGKKLSVDKKYKTSVPGQTTTRGQLRSDVFNALMRIEKLRSPLCSPKIFDTIVLSADDNTIVELWRIESCWRRKINYRVQLHPVPTGGTTMALSLSPNNDGVNRWLEETDRETRARDRLLTGK